MSDSSLPADEGVPANDFPGWDQIVEAGRTTARADDSIRRARAEIIRAAREEAAVSKRDQATQRRQLPRAGWMAAAVAAIFLVVGPVALAVSRQAPSETPITMPATASIVFENAAFVVAKGAPADWRDAPFWHVKHRLTRADGTSQTIDAYLGRRESSRTSTGDAGSYVLDPGPATFSLGTREVSWEGLYELPTDAAALSAVLAQSSRAGIDPGGQVFDTLSALLMTAPTSRDLRVALYRVASGIDHVQLVGPVEDSLGRQGIAVQHDDGLTTKRLVLDPATGQVLEMQVFTNHALPAIPRSATPQIEASYGGVHYGRAQDGSRPALSAGSLLEVDTTIEAGPSVIAPRAG